jgi:hypothetical protein
MIYLHTKFHILGSGVSVIITIKLEARGKFYTAPFLLFCSLENNCFDRCFEDLLPYAISEL